LGQILAGRRSRVRGGHGGSCEVTVGYGRLRRRKTEESGGTAGKRLKKNERNFGVQRGAASVAVRNKIVLQGDEK